MWPWEHLAIGYLCYSLGSRIVRAEPPSTDAVVLLVAATLLPDIVDKTLSWGLGLFPSGYAVGHSAFVAVPLGLLVLAVAAWLHRPALGGAFVVGYWSHLITDVLNPLRSGDPPVVSRVLWPVADVQPYPVDRGLGRGLLYLREFVQELATVGVTELLVVYLVVPGLALALWLLDGAPGVDVLTRGIEAFRSL